MAKDRFGFGTDVIHEEEHGERGMRGVSAQAHMQSNTAPNPFAGIDDVDWHDPRISLEFGKGKSKLPSPKPEQFKTYRDYERAMLQYADISHGITLPKFHADGKHTVNKLEASKVKGLAKKNWSNMPKAQAGSQKGAPNYMNIAQNLPVGWQSRTLPDSQAPKKKGKG
tara:strand:+ start:8534 stop:9037 length:504 start_codon:yes stop_codon:yes gene_type:complete